MKKEYPAASLILVVILCCSLFSQDYKQDSLAVRAILDSNSLGSVTVESVSKVGNSRIDTLIIVGKNLSKLPVVIGNISKLKHLDLHDNSLKTLPAEIGNLTQLLFADLRQNEIGNLPSTIGNLTLLTNLYLSTNSLKSLPAEIGQLSSLDRLYLEMNQLTALPAQLGNCANLAQLMAQFNQITSIPYELGRCAKLKTFLISNNRLATLPDSIIHLKPATGGLDLGNNSLDTNTISKTVIAWADQYDPDWRTSQTIGIKNHFVHEIAGSFTLISNQKIIQAAYTLPAACRIRISLYDTQGKLIQTVTDGMQSKGRHTVSFDKNRFGSSLYCLRFYADGYGAFTRGIVSE